MPKQLSRREVAGVWNAIRRECRERYIEAGGKFGPSGRPLIDAKSSGTVTSLAVTLAAMEKLPKTPQAEWLPLLQVGWGMGYARVALRLHTQLQRGGKNSKLRQNAYLKREVPKAWKAEEARTPGFQRKSEVIARAVAAAVKLKVNPIAVSTVYNYMPSSAKRRKKTTPPH